MVKIKALGHIAEIMGSRELTIIVNNKTKIRNLIKLPSEIESRVIILVNGKPATLDTEVKDEDQITIMPMISGG